MKKTYIITVTLAVIYSLFLFGCDKTEDSVVEPPTGGGEGLTKSFTSTASGSIDYDNFTIQIKVGDVPTQTSGSPGTVTFSFEYFQHNGNAASLQFHRVILL
jgi:hypothetical protein